jgi:hypothetical protein
VKSGVNLAKSGVAAGRELLAGRSAAGEVEAASKAPGVVSKILHGEKVAQPGAAQTLRTGAQASATDAGVAAEGATAPGQGIRTYMDKSIAAAAKTERATYDAITKAAGRDMKDLYEEREAIQDALDDPTNIANRRELEREMRVNNANISEGEDAIRNDPKSGVTLDSLNEAKAMTQQRYAMSEAKKKLFNNESVVSGNVKHGVEESINVDNAIKNAEAMDKPSKYAPEGTPTRLEQAFGKEGAFKLKQGLYDAQKTGESAVKVQKIAKWVGGVAGVPTAAELVHQAVK